MHSFKVLICYCSLLDSGLKGVVPWGTTHEYIVRPRFSPFSPIFPHFFHFFHFSVAQKRLGDSGVGYFQGLMTLHCACAYTWGSMRGKGKTGGGGCWKGVLEGVLEGVPAPEGFARRVR